ncbi:type II toxin-antitoxin system RelE family toxin [methanotrophic endosymbiont of Bathymodiolus puteoserpentis (Logatchev)]|jgi:mRNA-degrading endonuclease RelE of RelBE toxin-antitoxin system|uniref:type II toxin-antitoxin system RelE family toxin n=1 Tax=methanotrophic endosymbiont of Bathymodiolus puteoserpentis (Logatchev) TaxID=343235 RepID=UPI0013C9F362|nr:type II toxin-antitoxin system RelE/ParE family toxin [methanotrophic endosymbiont of Bathymodiolus puteoserpentis (Logatchev)]SHE19798.1 hypothetical protein BPUTEOMOX_2286 [methanotrophic endosymbiont of Bathymodiolus puteoserpentis (Logatchev)]
MRDYKLTKQAFKVLKLLVKNDPKVAKKIKNIINNLRNDSITGESLQGYRQFKKIRAGKYRLIYTYQEEILLIAIIEKRETVYQTFAHLAKCTNFLEK